MNPELTKWFVLGVNPEPWRVGPASVARSAAGKLFPKIGRDQQLHAYQEAIRSELRRKYNPQILGDKDSLWILHVFFWQRIEVYQTRGGRTARDKKADLTNLTKATEDAIQGVLIHNDVGVKQQHAFVVEQDSETEGCVVIGLTPYEGFDPMNIPTHIWFDVNGELRGSGDHGPSDDNLWDPSGVF